MAKLYTKEQFWKIYQKLPQELKDALFAEETGDNIYETCKRNDIEESLGTIVDYVGAVLIGLLPPEDFQEVLEKELTITKDKAKRITQEINRLIFYPVKSDLEQLYRPEITPVEKTAEKPIIEKPETGPRVLEDEESKVSFSPATEARENEEDKTIKPTKKDTYRELIE